MFTDIFARFSLRRSIAGIYFELRALRQLMEIRHEADGLESLGAYRSRHRDRRVAADSPDIPTDVSLGEEFEAERRAREVEIALLEGRDPGTSWRPDPNR